MGSGVIIFFFLIMDQRCILLIWLMWHISCWLLEGSSIHLKTPLTVSCAAEPCPAAVSQPLWLTEFAQVLAGARCACTCVFVVVVGDKRGKRMEVSIPFDMFLRKNRSS